MSNFPSAAPALVALRERLATATDLAHAAAVLEWDAETYLPDHAAAQRAEQTATLRRLAHDTLVADVTGVLLDAAAREAAPETLDADLVRIARRDRDRALCLPSRLVAERALATGRAIGAWQAARRASDFSAFAPHLARIVDLNIEEADLVRPLLAAERGGAYRPASDADARYDALLDAFEPGTTIADVGAVFDDLREGLVPLARAIAAAPQLSDDLLHRPFDEAAQWALSHEVAAALGYALGRGRLDRSAHPFSTSFGRDDVRITTRVDGDFWPTSFFGTVHEVGHALYEQGVAPDLDRTPLAEGTSLGMHESQSRLWENLVARSRGFWTWAAPIARRHAGGALDGDALDGATPAALYAAVNRVAPSAIRVEADEVTYHLHVMLRVEIERALIGGTLTVADVPEAWNAAMAATLGSAPASDADGCLQDVHWAHGTFGYFPTYTLGTLMSVPLFDAAARDLGVGDGFEAAFAAGEFAPLLGWLREHIHRYGRRRSAPEILRAATGEGLSAAPWLAYARRKYGALYGLDA